MTILHYVQMSHFTSVTIRTKGHPRHPTHNLSSPVTQAWKLRKVESELSGLRITWSRWGQRSSRASRHTRTRGSHPARDLGDTCTPALSRVSQGIRAAWSPPPHLHYQGSREQGTTSFQWIMMNVFLRNVFFCTDLSVLLTSTAHAYWRLGWAPRAGITNSLLQELKRGIKEQEYHLISPDKRESFVALVFDFSSSFSINNILENDMVSWSLSVD